MFDAFANVLGKGGKLLVEVIGVGSNPAAAYANAKKNALRRISELKLSAQVVALEVVVA